MAECPDDAYIKIKIKGGGNRVVRKCNVLTKVLLEKRRPVLFVGEGDFTFTVAFAAYRENYFRARQRAQITPSVESVVSGIESLQLRDPSHDQGSGGFRDLDPSREWDPRHVWNGIISTSFKAECDEQLPHMQVVKLGCISASALYFMMLVTVAVKRHHPISEDLIWIELDEVQAAIKNVPVPQESRWLCGVDACCIGEGLMPSSPGVVWFQCPWLNGSRQQQKLPPVIFDEVRVILQLLQSEKIKRLIESFLMNTMSKLQRGDLVCVGIINKGMYTGAYGLENILGEELRAEPNSTAVLKYYDFLGADDQLVWEVLKYGYHHQGAKDIHITNICNHVTLIFQRK